MHMVCTQWFQTMFLTKQKYDYKTVLYKVLGPIKIMKLTCNYKAFDLSTVYSAGLFFQTTSNQFCYMTFHQFFLYRPIGQIF